jgi:hypothetical protein
VTAEATLYVEAERLVYEVTLQNRGDDPLRDLRVRPRVLEGGFRVSDEETVVPLLRPRAIETVAFVLRGPRRPKVLEIAGTVRLSGRGDGPDAVVDLPPLRVDLSPPRLRAIPIAPGFEEDVSSWFPAEWTIQVPRPRDEVAALCERTLRRRGLGQGVVLDGAILHAGQDALGRRFAVGLELEATRDAKATVVAVHLFAEAEETLLGFRETVVSALRRALTTRTSA